jgi:hypothetical protein
VAASLAANCNLGAVYDATTDSLYSSLRCRQPREPWAGVWCAESRCRPSTLSLTKLARISESKSIQFRLDASNVLNHPVPNTPQLSLAPSAGVLNTSFGQIINANRFFDNRCEDTAIAGFRPRFGSTFRGTHCVWVADGIVLPARRFAVFALLFTLLSRRRFHRPVVSLMGEY